MARTMRRASGAAPLAHCSFVRAGERACARKLTVQVSPRRIAGLSLSLSLSVYVCGSSGASPFSKRDCLLKKGGGGKGGGDLRTGGGLVVEEMRWNAEGFWR